MEIPRYCRDCCFRTGETEIYTCAYALLTGRTRKAQPVGEGCTFKIKGERSTQDGMPEDLLLRQKRRKKPAKKKFSQADNQRRMELSRAGWSDGKIAAEFGVTPSAVAQWRKSRQLPAANRKGLNGRGKSEESGGKTV